MFSVVIKLLSPSWLTHLGEGLEGGVYAEIETSGGTRAESRLVRWGQAVNQFAELAIYDGVVRCGQEFSNVNGVTHFGVWNGARGGMMSL